MKIHLYKKESLCATLRKPFAFFAVKIIPAILFLFFTNAVFAQLPNTDIWLLNITNTGDSISVSNPVNITNRVGYDNQPAFTPDGSSVYYTSIRDEKQSDIYKYDLKTKQTSAITNTPTSEYSTTFMKDGKHFSVVMVEPDSTQRLWRYSLKGGKAKLLLPHVDSVGYHCWHIGNRVGVYLLTEPHSLCLASDDYKTPRYIDNNIGRCIKFHNTMLVYTKKVAEDKHQFCMFNLPGWHVKAYDSFMESEDFDLINKQKQQVVYGKGSVLYTTFVYEQKKKQLVDLSAYGIQNITRIAVSPDGKQMAIVAESK